MIKLILISTCIFFVVSETSATLSDPSLDGNYEDLQSFLQGFMSTYADTSYDTSQCLSSSTQSALDQELASTYLYLLSGQLDNVLQAYETFLTQLYSACNECGLSSVAASLKVGVSQKGKIWYEINLLYNSKHLESTFATLFTQLKAKQWTQAGSTVGQITNIIVPYTKVSLGLVDLDKPSYQAFWKGLVNTLSLNFKKQGPCAAFLLKLGNQTIPTATDFDMLNNGNYSGINTLFGDMAGLLTWWQGNYATDFCHFDLLETDLKSLTTKDGFTQMCLRYVARVLSINSAYLAVSECSSNTYSCGQGVGTIVKFLIGWSIY